MFYLTNISVFHEKTVTIAFNKFIQRRSWNSPFAQGRIRPIAGKTNFSDCVLINLPLINFNRKKQTVIFFQFRSERLTNILIETRAGQFCQGLIIKQLQIIIRHALVNRLLFNVCSPGQGVWALPHFYTYI